MFGRHAVWCLRNDIFLENSDLKKKNYSVFICNITLYNIFTRVLNNQMLSCITSAWSIIYENRELTKGLAWRTYWRTGQHVVRYKPVNGVGGLREIVRHDIARTYRERYRMLRICQEILDYQAPYVRVEDETCNVI